MMIKALGYLGFHANSIEDWTATAPSFWACNSLNSVPERWRSG